MEIFPFIEATEEEIELVELPVAKEYAWDFEKEDFKYRNGKFFIVEEKEAVKVWLWKLLKTRRYKEIIFSWDYGNESQDLIGRGYTKQLIDSEVERYVREAVEYNLAEYVTEIKDFLVDFKSSENLLSVSFTAITPYGEVEYSE